MRRFLLAIVAALLGACSGSADPGDDAAVVRMDSGGGLTDSGPGADSATPGVDAGDMPFDGGGSMGCPYPSGAVEPMELGAAIWPYQWPEAIAGDGTNAPLDLREVTCTEDPNRDWSPFDVLVFISIPAW